MRPRAFARLAAPALAAGAALLSFAPRALGSATTVSTPIAIASNNSFFAAVNPDNDTISVDPVSLPPGQKAHEYPVCKMPWSIAINAQNTKAYVACLGDGRQGLVAVVSMITGQVLKSIGVGTEPVAVALTSNGTKAYVANRASSTVSVIDTSTDTVVKTIYGVGPLPNTLAITDDGDNDDTDEKVYVGWWLAVYDDGVKPGDDLGKVGKVSVISTKTDTVTTSVSLNPLADTGFKADGDALRKIAPTGTATVTTGAFPNILGGMAFKNGRLYVPAVGSSPNGPNKFNVNVQALVSAIDVQTDVDAGKTVNLNSGVQFEADGVDAAGNPLKRFLTNPAAIAFFGNSNSGWVVSAASNQIVKVDLSGAGVPTINPPAGAGQADGIKRVIVGDNPRGLAITPDNSRIFVWNYVSRDVTVVDAATATALGRIILANQPGAGTQAATVQRGKLLFNTSIGPLSTVNGVVEGQMADRGWCACSSCHPDGLSDGVTWMFPSGPRRSTPLNATFAPSHATSSQRSLNWSAIFDEVADFELNTRNVAGGKGLILLANGDQDTNVKAFDPPSAGRNADRDAITEYLRFGIATPRSPIPAEDLRAGIGRKIFKAAGCVQCHSGANWTTSRVENTPPPPSSALVAEQGVSQLIGQLRQVGTFNPNNPWELIGTGANISKQALGASGFNVPSLRGLHALGPYLHDGSAPTLVDVLKNPAHVGTSPLLGSPGKVRDLVRFLQSIDDSTPPFAPPGGAREQSEDGGEIR